MFFELRIVTNASLHEGKCGTVKDVFQLEKVVENQKYISYVKMMKGPLRVNLSFLIK